jgi:hypothetical protein
MTPLSVNPRSTWSPISRQPLVRHPNNPKAYYLLWTPSAGNLVLALELYLGSLSTPTLLPSKILETQRPNVLYILIDSSSTYLGGLPYSLLGSALEALFIV